MRVRLIPQTGGDAKLFTVVSADLDTATGQLTLTCRDGRVCLGLVGAWQMAVRDSLTPSMSCDEIERVHDGRSLVLIH